MLRDGIAVFLTIANGNTALEADVTDYENIDREQVGIPNKRKLGVLRQTWWIEKKQLKGQ